MDKIKLWTFKKHLLLSLTIVAIVTFYGILSLPVASSVGIIGEVDSAIIALLSNTAVLFIFTKVILLLILLALYKPLKKIIEIIVK